MSAPTADTVNLSSRPEESLARKLGAVLLAVLAGVALVTQNGINTNLRRAIGNPLFTGFVSFSIGCFCCLVASTVHKPRIEGTALRQAPWYTWTGGVLGPIYVCVALELSSRLGFAVFQLCAIAGQLVSSLTCDGIGLLHLRKRKASIGRILAAMVAIGGSAMTCSTLKPVGAGSIMWTAVYCASSFVAGSIFPVQACVNGALQTYVGSPFRAATISFGVGAVILLIVSVISLLVSGGFEDIKTGESWMYFGGLMGCILVTSNVIGVPLVGAAAYVSVNLAAQLCTAFVFDVVGAFGFQPVIPSPIQVTGVAVTAIAALGFQLTPDLVSEATIRTKKGDSATQENIEIPEKPIEISCQSEATVIGLEENEEDVASVRRI